jgi:hypothetical protein
MLGGWWPSCRRSLNVWLRLIPSGRGLGLAAPGSASTGPPRSCCRPVATPSRCSPPESRRRQPRLMNSTRAALEVGSQRLAPVGPMSAQARHSNACSRSALEGPLRASRRYPDPVAAPGLDVALRPTARPAGGALMPRVATPPHGKAVPPLVSDPAAGVLGRDQGAVAGLPAARHPRVAARQLAP